MAIYNPSNHIPLSKAMGATRFPVDGKFMYFTNGENGKYEYRPFVSLAEVKTYFPLGSDFRKGDFEICVNTGGTLSGDGSYITGGINSIYWWANGVLDADLILKVAGGVPISKTIITGDQTDITLDNDYGKLTTSLTDESIFVCTVTPSVGQEFKIPMEMLLDSELFGFPNPSTNFTFKITII